MDVIYADELFALNALIDYLLLCLGARLAGLPRRRGRLLLAGGLGGAYALGAAMLPWLCAPGVKLAASLLLALAAWGGGRSLWRGWGAFLAVSALFAGAVCAAALLAGQDLPPRGLPARLSLRVLALSFGVCQAAVRLVLGCLERRQSRPTAEVALRLGERRAHLRALRDTGNTLADPLSGERVLIAGAEALAPLLGTVPDAEMLADAAALYRELSRDGALRSRLRLVPYSAVGQRSGVLVCFRPDAALVDGAEVTLLTAVSPTPVGGGEYDAIL